MVLPPGGVVSRAALFVNGVEQETVTAEEGEARAAYYNSYVQNRKALQVREISQDVVFVGCFPFPSGARSGNDTTEIQLGITVPVQLVSLSAGSLALPQIQRANFSVSERSSHSIHLASSPKESSGGVVITIDDLARNQQRRGDLRSDMGSDRLALLSWDPTNSPIVSLKGRGDPSAVRSASLPGVEGSFIQQSLTMRLPAPPKSLVVVIDGSAAMKDSLPLVEEFVSTISPSTNLSLFLADEGVEQEVLSRAIPTERAKEHIKQRLRKGSYQGSVDNGQALLAAMREAQQVAELGPREGVASRDYPPVIWLHAPQPYPFRTYKAVKAALEKMGDSVRLISIQTTPGRDEAYDFLAPMSALQSFDYSLTGSSALLMIRCRLLGIAECVEREFFMKTGSSTLATTDDSSRYLTYLWGVSEVRQLLRHGETAAAIALATELELVTPVTSAIVPAG